MEINTLTYRKLTTELWYTPRRFLVDNFFFNQVKKFREGALVIDLGGKKEKKRGVFNIEDYDLRVKYANLDQSTNPDYFCDITNVPVEDSTFDYAILAEVIEHVNNPTEIILEANRILKPNGLLLITTPFLYHVHEDPYDYNRPTPQWYEKNLREAGFEIQDLQKQGLFFGVIANLLKIYAYERFKQKNNLLTKASIKLSYYIAKNFMKWDKSKIVSNSKVLSSTTTGFGIICKKL